VAYARVTAPNDDAGNALVHLPEDVEAVPAAGDVLAADDVAVAPAAGDVPVDGVAPAAPSLQHGEAQMNQLHARSQAQKEERYPEPLGFPGQMELRLPVEFPKPLAPARQTVVVPPLAISTEAPALLESSHSDQSGALKIVNDYMPTRHRTTGFGA
jgi:hypothetical protein